MPTQTNASASAAEEMPLISNAVDDFVERGIGPDQADIRVISCIYSAFDYQRGDLKDDPPITVLMDCEPLGGENDNKNFEIRWSTGQNKLSEFDIVNDGGHLRPTATKRNLGLGTNWSEFLVSLKDCGFTDQSPLNSQEGITWFKGMELTVRKIPQKTRSGIADKNEKGYSRDMYTCFKISALPGETKKGARKSAAAKAPAPARAATPAATPASRAAMGQKTTAPADNGAGATGLAEAIELIMAAAANGPIGIKSLGQAVFQQARAAGKSVAESQVIGKLAMDPAFLSENSTDEELNERWSISGESLTLAV